MDAKLGAAATNTNNFEPLSDFVQEEDCDTLLIYLPGFTKEQLRVQLTRTGVLKISGTRPLGDNKWSSFQKDFPVSANCDTNKITAKFEDGILYVRQPKLIVPAEKEEQKTRPSKTPHSRIPADEPPAPKTDHEQATTPDKPVHNKEAKDEQKSSKSEGTKKEERNNIPEKTGNINDDHKATARSSGDKHENVSGKTDAELANKGTNRNAVAKVDDYKLDAGSPAAKLRMTRQKMTMVLAVLFAFALGMYISNMAWFSKKAEN
ncbi:hypothetical protein DH2020_000885 [Rehmannia glutinosa]|uniref:SHSP domain-containing protein n=1 Tax=Rehmannia glutinosa TaxID=99300 RepID=A0ABR0XY46_REHGL